MPLRLPLFLTILAATTALAQQREGTYAGTIKGVRGNVLLVEVDGQTGPVATDAQTKLTVAATGDGGFLTPGVMMAVTGSLRPEGKLTGARFTLHPNAKQTLTTKGRTVNAADPKLTVAARLLSKEPFVVQTLEAIQVQRDGRTVTRVPAGQKLPVSLASKDPKEVDITLGPAARLIAEGDAVRLTFKKGRAAATAVSVTKSQPMSSKPVEGDSKKADE